MTVDTREADLHDALDLIEQLTDALRVRAVVCCAKGILMERYALEAEPAFDVLVRMSSELGIALHRAAQRIVDGEPVEVLRAPRPRAPVD